LISREEFVQFLSGPQLAFIYDCIKGGLGDYEDTEYYSAAARRDHNPRVRANIRNCHIVARGQRRALEMSEVRVRNVRGRILFVINDIVQISFKKFDARLHSRNIRTPQAQAFLVQSALWPGNDAPISLTNIIAGFRQDISETNFELWITCPSDNKNIWELRLAGAEIAELFPAGAADGPEEPKNPIRERVRLRPRVVRKNGTDESTDEGNEPS
jgi:hypothetical protein